MDGEHEHQDKPCPVGNRWGPEIARLNTELMNVRHRMNSYEQWQAVQARIAEEHERELAKMSPYEIRIDRGESEQSRIGKVLTDLMHTVWGNGKDGLTTRMDRMEQGRKQTVTMLSAIGAAAMALMGTAVQLAIAFSGK